MNIPPDFPVQPDGLGNVTCGTCGMTWDDNLSTAWTPVPAGRCPFEYFHEEEK